jgi:hypothetical protein
LITARRRTIAFADLNIGVVNMREHLAEVAHVEPFSAGGAFHEMVGLGFGGAVRICAGVAGNFTTWRPARRSPLRARSC